MSLYLSFIKRYEIIIIKQLYSSSITEYDIPVTVLFHLYDFA